MAKMINIPKLRFPEFQGEWKKTRFADVTIKVGDGLHGTPTYSDNSDIYFINGNNLLDGKVIINDTTKKIDEDTYVRNNKGLNENTLLISINGTIGNVSKYRNEKVMLGKSVGYYIFNHDCSFYYHLLRCEKVQNQFISELTGSTIKNLSLKTLRETEVFIPLIPEQKKISNFLSIVDDKISNIKKKKNLLEKYKKGIMQQLFSQELRFKDEVGNDFPEWEIKNLGAIAKITTGSSNREDSNLDGQYTFFDRSQDIRSSNRYLFDAEAIIVPGEGQRFIPKHFIGKFDLHQRTYAIMDFAKQDGKYLFYFISFHDNHLISYSVGSTVKSLRLPMFEKMPIQLPTLPEQQKIASFLSALDDKIAQTTLQIEKMQLWKKGLLQQMFV